MAEKEQAKYYDPLDIAKKDRILYGVTPKEHPKISKGNYLIGVITNGTKTFAVNLTDEENYKNFTKPLYEDDKSKRWWWEVFLYEVDKKEIPKEEKVQVQRSWDEVKASDARLEKVEKAEKRRKDLDLEEKIAASKVSSATAGFLAIGGFILALIFLSSNFTGYAIANLNQTASNYAAIIFFILGLIASFIYFRKKK